MNYLIYPLLLLALTGCSTQAATKSYICQEVLKPISMGGVVPETQTEDQVVLHNCRYLKICGKPGEYEEICIN